MKKHAFYVVAAVEAVILLCLVAYFVTSPNSANDSGGKEMALFFFALVPLAVVALVTVLYRFCSWRIVRALAFAVLIVPPAFLAYNWIAEGGTDRSEEDFKSGRGIFAEGQPTALAQAIAQGDAAQVATLAPKVAINQRGKYGYSFLTYAFVQPTVDNNVVAALLKAGVNPNGTNSNPVTDTVFANDAARLTMLLDAGADPNPHNATGEPDIFYMTEQPEMLRILLRRGAKVDTVNASGWTVLMAAARDGHWPAVDVLLAAGADPKHQASDGTTLADVLVKFKTDEQQAGRPVPPQLLTLETLLAKGAAKR